MAISLGAVNRFKQPALQCFRNAGAVIGYLQFNPATLVLEQGCRGAQSDRSGPVIKALGCVSDQVQDNLADRRGRRLYPGVRVAEIQVKLPMIIVEQTVLEDSAQAG